MTVGDRLWQKILRKTTTKSELERWRTSNPARGPSLEKSFTNSRSEIRKRTRVRDF
jgi:hypothetical protein